MLEGLLQEREQLGARLVGSGSGHCGKRRGMRPAGRAGPGLVGPEERRLILGTVGRGWCRRDKAPFLESSFPQQNSSSVSVVGTSGHACLEPLGSEDTATSASTPGGIKQFPRPGQGGR